jgi:hypothetical protein
MKAYLETKAEAAKSTIFNFPAVVKAWPGKKWENTKRTLKVVDWPVTITHFIGWTVRQSVQGVLFGMGALTLLIHGAAWSAVDKRDLPEGPIPILEVYELLHGWLALNFIFAGAGILACMVINSYNLRLHRLPGHDIEEQEFRRVVREALERLDEKKPKIS